MSSPHRERSLSPHSSRESVSGEKPWEVKCMRPSRTAQLNSSLHRVTVCAAACASVCVCVAGTAVNTVHQRRGLTRSENIPNPVFQVAAVNQPTSRDSTRLTTAAHQLKPCRHTAHCTSGETHTAIYLPKWTLFQREVVGEEDRCDWRNCFYFCGQLSFPPSDCR